MLALISAPSNLGLRPPQPGSVPGTAKAPEALREAGLHARLAGAGAVDAGVVLPGRYTDDVQPGVPRTRNQDALLDHADRLAARIGEQLSQGRAPLILGGDCSLLVAAGRALSVRGRYGLVHIDGHTDFRHPGNSAECYSLAGEDLAAAVGLHWPALTGPGGGYFRPGDAVHVGCRDDDEHLAEASRVLAQLIPARRVRVPWLSAAKRVSSRRARSQSKRSCASLRRRATTMPFFASVRAPSNAMSKPWSVSTKTRPCLTEASTTSRSNMGRPPSRRDKRS